MKIKLQIIVLTVLAAIVTQPLRAADDAAQAQSLIDRVIMAMGGNKAVEKTRNSIIDDVGIYYGMGEGVPYTGRYVYSVTPPGRFRMEIVGQFIQVVDGNKSWMSAMGNVLDVDGVGLEVAQEGMLVNYAMTLIPLQKRNDDFKLGLAPAETVDGEECAGITVDHKKMPKITMYFSKKSGLIKKTSYRMRAAESGFQEVLEEAIYHTYKESDGVQTPTKMTMFRDGKKFVESNPQKVTYPDSVDDSEFKKPS